PDDRDTQRRATVLRVLLDYEAKASIVAQPKPSLEDLARVSLAPIDVTIRVPGLSADVQVMRDTWGVPHIYAQSTDDLFFAQGYVMAQERLWQLEMWRRC